METSPSIIELDLNVYRLSAVKKAAYKFGDRCHIAIHPLSQSRVRVELRAKRMLDNQTFLLGEFQNELLDQELREVVASETRPIRDLLLAQAFSATSLINPAADEADFRDDPLGFGVSDKSGQQQEAG